MHMDRQANNRYIIIMIILVIIIIVTITTTFVQSMAHLGVLVCETASQPARQTDRQTQADSNPAGEGGRPGSADV